MATFRSPRNSRPGYLSRMIIRPRVRGFVCVTAHPDGCAANVAEQIDLARSAPLANPPRSVLVLGASASYGLASRIALAFGGGAATFGVFFDRPPTARRPGTAGWYNTAAFEKAASDAGLVSGCYNGDAFSAETKERVIDALKRDFPPVDCVVNSVAAPRRVHPESGKVFNSVLKPIGKAYRSKTLDTGRGEVLGVELPPATPEEVEATVAVMGGDDWQRWIDALEAGGVLAPGCRTFAYSYIGPELTWPIYRDGAIGQAKEDLHRTAVRLNERLAGSGSGAGSGAAASPAGSAHVAVMKAVVTQASAAIPVVPLYVSILYKIMKASGDHERPIEQALRLYGSKVYGPNGIDADPDDFIRLDDLEMKPETQAAVMRAWEKISTETLGTHADFDGYQSDFLGLFGFGVSGVEYDADTDPLAAIPSLA